MIAKHWKVLGKALDSNADEIEQLYHTPENELELEKVSSGWQFLLEHGLVLGNLHAGYSPSSLLLQLGDVLSLANNRQTQAPDVSEWLENMKRLVNRYHIAKTDNNEIDQNNIRRDIYSDMLFMQTTLENEVSQLEYFIDNKFGHVNSLKAKQEENQYCIGRASRSAEKLTILNEHEITILCGNDDELLQIFLHKLLPSVKNCRNRLLATIPRLKSILWEYRRINQRTHLVHFMHNYLQSGQGFPTDTLANSCMQDSPFNRVSPFTIHSFADVRDRSQRSQLINIVKSMRKNKYADSLDSEPETQVNDIIVDTEENGKVDIPEPLLKPYLLLFIKAVKKEKQSARLFWIEQKTNIVPIGIWIWWLHLQIQQAKNSKLLLAVCLKPASKNSGNKIITDITVDLKSRSNGNI